MKKQLSLLLCTAMLSTSLCAFANGDTDDWIIVTDGEPVAVQTTDVPEASEAPMETEEAVESTEEPKEEATELPGTTAEPQATVDPYMLSNQVTLEVGIDKVSNLRESSAKFELYTAEGQLIATKELEVTATTDKLMYTFDVPEYEIGTKFKFRLAGGLTNVRYYADTYNVGEDMTFSTYIYEDSDGNEQKSLGIIIGAKPLLSKSVSFKYDGVPVDLYPGAKLINGVTMVPARKLAEYIGFDVRYNPDYNVEVISLGSNQMLFNIDTTYTTIFGNDLNALAPTQTIDGTVYIALRTFAEAIGSTLDVVDYNSTLYINMTPSPFVSKYFQSIPVNRWGITSRTDNMVWVSLSEYKVRVYSGKQYQWKLLRECPCAIGAPSTPTVTGSFEYKYTDRWNYNGYYVGPCLVFYGGYALHSVLLRYDGSEYDGRTGVMISHGCIRLKKKDIDWIYNEISIGTRIYVTP